MERLNVGIIGIGNMGSAHLNCIRGENVPGMYAVAVCDIDPQKLSLAKEKYGDLCLYEDYCELLDNADIDAVIIAVPHPMHAIIAAEAFKHGKHVLLEKPEDIKVSAAKKLNEIAHNSGKVFGIMFNQRTNGLFKEARRLVRSGELGELKRSVWIITNWYRTEAYYRSGTWRATWAGEGGGVLLNQAPHNLDLWQWICGEPERVTAFCNEGKFHDIEVEDEATIYTTYKNGATGVFITSTGDLPGTNRFEITGTKGKVVIENGVLKHWKLPEDERITCKESEKFFVDRKCEYSEFTCEKETGHRGILCNFTNSILKGEELLAPGYDGINELMISCAAYLSEWSGNKAVELPFDDDTFDTMLQQKAAVSRYKPGHKPSAHSGNYSERWQVNW